MSIQDGEDLAAPAQCPMCLTANTAPWHRDGSRDYLRCAVCALVHVPRAQHLDRDAERQRYDQHNNDPADPGYRRFLSALFEPLRERLGPGAAGLDFGSGPGPTLSRMFEESGHPMRLYDPYYADDPDALSRCYDFVSCSETVEHFCDPARDWARLAGLLKPGGWLGVMTSLLDDDIDFPRWYYKDDPTHVAFHTPATITWIANHHALQPTILSPSIILLHKPPTRGLTP